MNLYSLVFSPTGGTQKASDALCAGLDLPVHKVDLCDSRSDYSSLVFSKEDIWYSQKRISACFLCPVSAAVSLFRLPSA